MKLLSFVIIEKEDRFLLIQETARKWKDKWFFPGGHMKRNEDPVTAVVRETKEEAGYDIRLEGVFHFRLYKGLLSDTLHLYYHGKTVPDPDISKTPDRVKWFTYDEIMGLRLRQNALQVIDTYRAMNTSLPIYNFNFIRKKVIRSGI